MHNDTFTYFHDYDLHMDYLLNKVQAIMEPHDASFNVHETPWTIDDIDPDGTHGLLEDFMHLYELENQAFGFNNM